MKTKLTNMLRGKERRTRKKEQICKVKQRQKKNIHILYRLTKEKKAKKYMQKKYNRFKNLKVKIIKKRKEKKKEEERTKEK